MLTDCELHTLPAELRVKVEKMDALLKIAQFRVMALEAELRLERIRKYGAASESLTDAQLELLDSEPGVSPMEVQQEAGLPQPQKEAVKKNPSRSNRGTGTLPPELPREEEIIACAKEDCTCPQCHGERKLIGFEISERLHRIPARYVVKVIKREKKACPKCEECGVSTAPMPPQIIAKGIGNNELVVDVLLSKYELHLPLYRQEVAIQRESHVALSRQTMCGWMMECGFLFGSICREIKRDLFEGGVIQADETPVGVRDPKKKGSHHRSFLWQYSRPDGPVLFDYQDGRGRDGPQRMLKGFKGTLQTDDYSVYGRLDLPGVQHAACMAHVRRKFVEASKVHTQDKALVEIIDQIAQLYAIEAEARELHTDAAQRHVLRQKKSRPLMEVLKGSIVSMRSSVLPKSLQGKACQYALGVWTKLEVYLQDGRIAIDNNACENAMRPIALGRKNWLHFGSKEAGPQIAAILSVIETCHRLKINVREYLLDILPKLATGKASDVAALTPMAWKQTQQPTSA